MAQVPKSVTNGQSYDIVLVDVPAAPQPGIVKISASATVDLTTLAAASDLARSAHLAHLVTAGLITVNSKFEMNQTGTFNGAGAPTDGTSGTGAGAAAAGSLYSDSTNGAVYVNVNTAASPTWKQLAQQD